MMLSSCSVACFDSGVRLLFFARLIAVGEACPCAVVLGVPFFCGNGDESLVSYTRFLMLVKSRLCAVV